MKKKLLLVAAILLALGGSAGAYYYINKEESKQIPAPTSGTAHQKSPTNNQLAETPEAPKTDKAVCSILSQEIASKVLGEPAKPSDANKEAPNNSDHVVVSTCSYNSADNSKTTTLLMRAAIDAEGSAHDKDQFGPNKPSTAQVVSEYEDSAYWDADFRQLNILKGTTWYILTNGSNEVSERTLDQAKQLANLIITKL